MFFGNPMVSWRPDLHSLQLFVAVCEEGSFARDTADLQLLPDDTDRLVVVAPSSPARQPVDPLRARGEARAAQAA